MILLEHLLWILEEVAGIFEHLHTLLENPEHLLEQVAYILESQTFIRRFWGILEYLLLLLEKNRALGNTVIRQIEPTTKFELSTY